MDEKHKAKLSVLSKLHHYTVNFFHEEGFMQLGPLMWGLSVDPLGPDPGSSVVQVPQTQYQGQDLSSMTSMILHKQVGLQRGLEKLFIMSCNSRFEHPERKSTGKHLFEFTQADFEIAYGKMDGVFNLVEDYFVGLPEYLVSTAWREFEELGIPVFDFEPPFKAYTKKYLKSKYGGDWEKEASLREDQPFWVIGHKREFYDAEDPENPGTYLNYDIVYPFGFGEGLSGGEREHDYDRILMRIERDNLPLKNYTSYLEKAKEGFVPSAGAGIGMERLARFLTRSEHVGDVTLFRRVPRELVDI